MSKSAAWNALQKHCPEFIPDFREFQRIFGKTDHLIVETESERVAWPEGGTENAGPGGQSDIGRTLLHRAEGGDMSLPGYPCCDKPAISSMLREPQLNAICLKCYAHWYGTVITCCVYTRQQWDAYVNSEATA